MSADDGWEEFHHWKGWAVHYEPTLVLISARRRSSGQDSAEREQVSPGLLFALKLNSIGWGFHRHQECTADAFAEQGERITDFLGTEKKFIHQVTPAVKVRTSSKVSSLWVIKCWRAVWGLIVKKLCMETIFKLASNVFILKRSLHFNLKQTWNG